MPRKAAYCVWELEVVSDQQGTIAALLSTSPGGNRRADYAASGGKSIKDRVSSPQWQAKLKNDRSVLWTQAER